MGNAARTIDGELPKGLTVDEFLAWTKERPGRFELHDGQVVAMSPERVIHATIKGNVYRKLADAIAKAKLECRALPDGVGVKISDRKWYEPDALVHCGPPAPPDALFVADPIVVVEVGSPSTMWIDETEKLIGYFSLPSVQHYLIINPNGLPLIHHQRQADGSILTRIVAGGGIRLDPPGFDIDVDGIFA